MSSFDRRAAARRRAWGRGPKTLRFEPLEGRQLMAGDPPTGVVGAADDTPVAVEVTPTADDGSTVAIELASTTGVAAESSSTTSAGLPDLVATAFDTLHNLDWGDGFRAVGTVTNRGTAAAASAFRVDVVAVGRAPGATPTFLGTVEAPAGLAPGQSFAINHPVTLPAFPIAGSAGEPSIDVRLVVDPGGAVAESDEANNAGLGAGVDSSMVTITPRLAAQLQAQGFQVTPSQVRWGESIAVTASVLNVGQGAAPATRSRVVLTPNGLAPGGLGDVTVGDLEFPALNPGQGIAVTRSITLPAAAPSTLVGVPLYTISVHHDADHEVSPVIAAPTFRGPGLDFAPISVTTATPAAPPRPQPPNLLAVNVQAPNQPLVYGGTLTVTADVHNLGRGDAAPAKVRFILTGPDASPTGALALADATTGTIRAGGVQTIAQTLRLPSRPAGTLASAPGVGRIVVQIDPENTLDESNERDNGSASGPVILRVLGSDGIVNIPPPIPSPIQSPQVTPATPTLPLTPTPVVTRPVTPTNLLTGLPPTTPGVGVVPIRLPVVAAPTAVTPRQAYLNRLAAARAAHRQRPRPFGLAALRARNNPLRVFPNRPIRAI